MKKLFKIALDIVESDIPLNIQQSTFVQLVSHYNLERSGSVYNDLYEILGHNV
jgi:hypothetical protein